MTQTDELDRRIARRCAHEPPVKQARLRLIVRYSDRCLVDVAALLGVPRRVVLEYCEEYGLALADFQPRRKA